MACLRLGAGLLPAGAGEVSGVNLAESVTPELQLTKPQGPPQKQDKLKLKLTLIVVSTSSSSSIGQTWYGVAKCPTIFPAVLVVVLSKMQAVLLYSSLTKCEDLLVIPFALMFVVHVIHGLRKLTENL
jgi:hypothetical protein